MTKVVAGVGATLVAMMLCIPLIFSGGGAAASVAGGSSAMGTAQPGALQPAFAGVPARGYSTGTFPYGQCTYWAAYNWGGPAGLGVTWSGDAWQWVANAAAQGHAVQSRPSVGAIVVYMRGNGYDPEFGHVAVVTAVAAASYTVSEMHYIGLGAVDTRTISLPDPHVLAYLPAS